MATSCIDPTASTHSNATSEQDLNPHPHHPAAPRPRKGGSAASVLAASKLTPSPSVCPASTGSNLLSCTLPASAACHSRTRASTPVSAIAP